MDGDEDEEFGSEEEFGSGSESADGEGSDGVVDGYEATADGQAAAKRLKVGPLPVSV